MTDKATREIAATLAELAHADTKPTELYRAVRQKHPDASKKDIMRAAFRAVIDGVKDDPDRGMRIHGDCAQP